MAGYLGHVILISVLLSAQLKRLSGLPYAGFKILVRFSLTIRLNSTSFQNAGGRTDIATYRLNQLRGHFSFFQFRYISTCNKHSSRSAKILVQFSFCIIALLSYCPIVLFLNSNVVLLPHCRIVLLPYCPNAKLP